MAWNFSRLRKLSINCFVEISVADRLLTFQTKHRLEHRPRTHWEWEIYTIRRTYSSGSALQIVIECVVAPHRRRMSIVFCNGNGHARCGACAVRAASNSHNAKIYTEMTSFSSVVAIASKQAEKNHILNTNFSSTASRKDRRCCRCSMIYESTSL